MRLFRRLAGSRTEALPGRKGAAPQLVVVLEKSDPELSARLSALSPRLAAVTRDDPRMDLADFVYAPDRPEAALPSDALRSVLLRLAHLGGDFVIVSHGLGEPPYLEIVTPRNALVTSRETHRHLESTGRLPEGAHGWLARLLPGPPGFAVERTDVSSLDLGPLRAIGPELVVGDAAAGSHHRIRSCRESLFRSGADSRRTVLVLPIMLAVGGAERNLINVMRELQERYAFVVVTTERVSSGRGSLNHEIAPLCQSLFELGELAPPDAFALLLDAIARDYRPELVFICNGSPWLLAHTALLRERFRNLPIVDQQVYDAREGWIEFYDDRGIQSFDRFVAINRKIRDAFRRRFEIPAERIDLIYHGIDDERFHLAAADRVARGTKLSELGIPDGCRLFAQVGRLTSQKQPLRFLDLARRARDAGLDDRFLLIGDGELSRRCDVYRAEHALENVVMLPFSDDMSQVYPLLDGLVISSVYEGLPLVMLEALAMGVPILATDVGDVRLVLEEHGGGRVLDRSAGARAAFEAFLDWRSELATWRSSARAAAPAIRERFSARAAAAAYERCWQKAWAGLTGRGGS